MMYSKEYVQKLRDENQELLDEIIELKKTFIPKIYEFPKKWRLYRRQKFILTVLLNAKHTISKERLYCLCLKEEDKDEKYTTCKNIETTICTLRSFSGVAICCKRYEGYFIDEDEKQRVFKLIGAASGKSPQSK